MNAETKSVIVKGMAPSATKGTRYKATSDFGASYTQKQYDLDADSNVMYCFNRHLEIINNDADVIRAGDVWRLVSYATIPQDQTVFIITTE